MSTRVLTVPDAATGQVAIAEAAQAISDGKLVAFATETVYGIAALASNAETIARLRKLKDRPTGGFSLHLPGPDRLGRYVETIPLRAHWLIERAWPGPVTLLLPTGGALADESLQAIDGLYESLTVDGVIGLRCPDEPVARALLDAVDGPVVAPSANLAGAPSPRQAEEVIAGLGEKIDLVVDSGPSRFGTDSTIVKFSGEAWQLIRQGVCDEAMIQRFMHRKFAFVCTGNTCRSPMAAALAGAIFAEKLGCDITALKAAGVEISSAGVVAGAGSRATAEACHAMAGRDLDLSSHRSRRFTESFARRCDRIFTMTADHADLARQIAPAVADRIEPLDPAGDIADPIGGGQAVYETTADQIDRALRARINLGMV